ncbi:MAG TPA: AraC family transcriptional regulator [Alphaproteobacteria bacterium]|nr:AraC family transcriptional regulator [Alphaproteobacteria bacterium]
MRRVPTAEPQIVGFRPAGVGVHTVIPAAQYGFVAVFQDLAIYRDLAAETTWPATATDLEPQSVIQDPQAAQLITTLVEEMSGGGLDPLLVDTVHIALALRMSRHFLGPRLRALPAGRLSRERLRRVLDYIEANLGSLALSDLAAVACLSPFHFSRCFAQSMGVGPHRFVMGRRIARARHLLLHSDMSLSDIADAVGFDSQASFTARFGRELGMSPGRLRRERA